MHCNIHCRTSKDGCTGVRMQMTKICNQRYTTLTINSTNIRQQVSGEFIRSDADAKITVYPIQETLNMVL